MANLAGRTVALVTCVAWIAGCATLPKVAAPGGTAPPPAFAAGESAGVEVVSLRPAVAGYMLDFRFRVTDPEKARDVLQRGTSAYLIDQATGERLVVPNTKVGDIRQTTLAPKKGQVYFLFFKASGRGIQPGDRVTVVIGKHRFENLTVQ